MDICFHSIYYLAMPVNISADYLRARVHYDPIVGIFTWKPRLEDDPKVKSWNTRYAERIAGYRRVDSYWRLSIDDKHYLAHRLAWLYMTGEWPTHQIDHKDLDRTNNKFENLRPATHGQNKHNRRANSNNKCGLKGVHYRWSPNRRKHWVAQIMVDRKYQNLGVFLTKEEAAAAYAKAAAKLHKEFNRTL